MTEVLASRLPATLELAFLALLVAIIIGGAGAIAGTLMRRTFGETMIDSLNSIMLAVPDFIWALALVLLFAVAIPILPLTGRIDPELAEGFTTRFYLIESVLTGRFAVAGDIISHMIMPTLALALPLAAVIVRLLKQSLKEAMLQDYVLLARIKGFRELRLVLQEALRNAVGPTLALTGVQFTFMIGGTVIVERIFAYPGIGNLAIDAVINRDFPADPGPRSVVRVDLHPDQYRGRSHRGGAQSALAACLRAGAVEHWSPTSVTSTAPAEPRPPSIARRLAGRSQSRRRGRLHSVADRRRHIRPADRAAGSAGAKSVGRDGAADRLCRCRSRDICSAPTGSAATCSRASFSARAFRLRWRSSLPGLACLIGSLLGLLAGFLRGWVDAVISRLVDIWMAFPPVLLSILLVAILGAGMHSVIAAIVVIDWTRFCRVVRTETMGQAQMDYVVAARTIGFSRRAILFREILPNVMPVLIALLTLEMGIAVVVEAILSFVGLSVSSDTPTWGGMIAEGRQIVHEAWWVLAAPLVALFATVVAFNQLGDGLARSLDPVLRR